MSDLIEWLAWTLVFLLIVLPPKYDPAIRWKERNERKRNGGDDRG